MQYGRQIIYTDVPEITYKNVITVLRESLNVHLKNANDIDFLINYEAGEQPIIREKKYRPDINAQVQDNIANEVTEFKRGFLWGNPITLIQNSEIQDEEKTKAIVILNKEFEADDEGAKTQQIGRYVEIVGQCYEYIDLNSEWEDGESYHKSVVLDPRTSFVVYSSYYTDQRMMMGVTYRKDRTGNRWFTCITKEFRFEIKNLQTIENGQVIPDKEKWMHDTRSGEKNPFGIINIVEWLRSYDRMGCFERQIPEMDNLNLLVSDFTNDVEQNTQAVWHTNDVEFPTEVIENEDGTKTEVDVKPKDGDWVGTFTSEGGKTPFIKPLVIDYSYDGMLNNIINRRSLILQKCNVPQRNDNSGGSTGVAMSDATGWSAAEMAANAQQPLQEMAKMREVKVVLAVIKKSEHIPSDSPLLKLKPSDTQSNIKRQRTYEMTTKINCLATGISHGINGEYMINAINFFDDPNAVWNASKDSIEAYQHSIFDKNNEGQGGEGEAAPNSDRIMQDKSDQIGNSPMIDKSRTNATS